MNLKWLKILTGYFCPYNGISTPIVLQQTSTECGLAALAMLFNYYKCYISVDELRNQYGLSRDGTRIIDLIHIAQYYHFHVQAYTMDMDAISYLTEPVIAFWNFNHFIVINGAGYKKIFINDPAKGNYAVSLETFNKSFTGIVLHLTPPSNRLPASPKPQHMKTLLKQMVMSFRKEIIFIGIIIVIINFQPILSGGLIKVFIDQCLIGGNCAWLPSILGLLVATTCIYLLATLPCKWIEFKLYLNASLRHSKKIINHILHLPLIYFAVRPKSEVISLLAQINVCMDIIYRTLLTIFSRTTILVILIVSMVLINWFWTFLVGLMLIISIGIISLTTQIKLNYDLTNQHHITKHYARTVAWLKNLVTIKSCALENNIFELWYSDLISKLQQHEKIRNFDAMLTVIQHLLSQLSYFSIILFGGIAVASNTESLGQLIFFLSLTNLSTAALNTLLQAIKDNQQGLAVYKRINEITFNQMDQQFLHQGNYVSNSNRQSFLLQHNSHQVDLGKGKIIIRCNQVSFSYNKRFMPIIKDINLDVTSGEHIGIVGRTGSGKSTLAKLLCGLYHAQQGNIHINQNDMHTLDPQVRARLFAYVSQDTGLLRGSLFDNLTLGNPRPDNHLIEQGITIACLEEVINQKGLYSEVEENAMNFSGGEKQRINIARAIIQNTPILILDEATAAIDEEMEAQIIHRLRQTHQTIIWVAHRLTSVKHCDKIIVIEKGSIIELGTHETLLKKNGFYAQLTAAKAC